MARISIIILIILSSCSASFHAKRALKKNPNAFKSDTTVVVDTIFIETPKVDTSFVYQFDTVSIEVDKVRIKYHYDTLSNEVYIEADCPDTEVINITETITETVIVKPSFKDRLLSVIYFILFALFVYGVFKLVKIILALKKT